MADVHVIRTQTVADPNPARAGQGATWVTYQVLPAGPVRSTIIPKANPSEAEVRAAIADAERSAGAVEGKRFTI